MTLPLLYTYRRCPYAMRARMALLQAGLPFERHEISLRDKPPGLLTASPKGTVPVLVLPDGQVIDESWAIVEWALTHPDAHPAAWPWWQRACTNDHQTLLQTNDGLFKHHLDRYKYPERFETLTPDTREAVRAQHRLAAVEVLLQPLEQRLQTQAYLGGSEACATDIGIFPFVRQFAAVDPAWFSSLPLPGVQAWLARWLSSPLFEACMKKND
jgi:glutathione S-transferase